MQDQFVAAGQGDGDPVAGPWEFRAVWPVEDADLGSQQAIAAAAADLPDVLARHEARLLGTPEFKIQEVPDPERWPYTEFAVVAVAPAVPASPTREQWPVIIDRLGFDGWTDRRIAELFNIPIALVETLHRGVFRERLPALPAAA